MLVPMDLPTPTERSTALVITSTPELIVPDFPADPSPVPFRTMLDPITKDELGLCFGANPQPSAPASAWIYGPDNSIERNYFDSVVWPLMPDDQRNSFAEGRCALIFR